MLAVPARSRERQLKVYSCRPVCLHAIRKSEKGTGPLFRALEVARFTALEIRPEFFVRFLARVGRVVRYFERGCNAM